MNANCTKTAGSYNCTCRPGYTGNGSICKGKNLGRPLDNNDLNQVVASSGLSENKDLGARGVLSLAGSYNLVSVILI